MDPRYIDNCEFNTLSIAPLEKKSCEINEASGLLRLVSLLGLEKS